MGARAKEPSSHNHGSLLQCSHFEPGHTEGLSKIIYFMQKTKQKNTNPERIKLQSHHGIHTTISCLSIVARMPLNEIIILRARPYSSSLYQLHYLNRG